MVTTISQTARAVLKRAAGQTDYIATSPEHLPAAARRSVIASLLKNGLLEEIAAQDGQTVWRMSETGEQLALRAAPAGLAIVATSRGKVKPQEERAGTSKPLHDGANLHGEATRFAATNRLSLRMAAAALLTAWDAMATRPSCLAVHINALRAVIAKPVLSAVPCQPRPDTKRAAVLTMLRRSEGATVAQVAEATGWARHTVHGFFAGLKKAGTPVEVLERIRQIGPGKQGAAGSYTVYRVKDAG